MSKSVPLVMAKCWLWSSKIADKKGFKGMAHKKGIISQKTIINKLHDFDIYSVCVHLIWFSNLCYQIVFVAQNSNNLFLNIQFFMKVLLFIINVEKSQMDWVNCWRNFVIAFLTILIEQPLWKILKSMIYKLLI